MDSFSSGYKPMEDTNAIKLAGKVVNCMGKGFAGEQAPYFLYQLTCYILHNLEFNKDKLLKDIDEFKVEDYDFLNEDKKSSPNQNKQKSVDSVKEVKA
jgi:hypothetical protein